MGDARTLSLMENGVKLPFERVILRQKLVTTEIVVAEIGGSGGGVAKKNSARTKNCFQKHFGVGTQFGDSVASKRPKSGGGTPGLKPKLWTKRQKWAKK